MIYCGLMNAEDSNNMACLFGHKWRGCVCVKCGRENHEFHNLICTKCGKIDDFNVNEATINRLVDLEALEKIAKDDIHIPDRNTARLRRKQLIEEITDQSLLMRIVNKNSEFFRSDRHGTKEIDYRIIAVKHITDQLILARIAQEIPGLCVDVRNTAIMQLTDQSILTTIARNDHNSIVREAAITKLDDQSVLATIAQNDLGRSVREAAITKLTDQSILAAIAQNDPDWAVRVAATKKLDDQSVLAMIAQNDLDSIVRQAAIKKITNQRILSDIAINNICNEGLFALGKMTGRELILNVARKAQSDDIIEKAYESINGYICSACKRENLSEEGKPVTCECRYCKTENHRFIEEGYEEDAGGHAMRQWFYERCIRCNRKINERVDVRFTDW